MAFDIFIAQIWRLWFAWTSLRADRPGDPELDTHHETTVILGGGIIGLSTAYYLAQDLHENGLPPHRIILIDPAPVLFAGASGGATGVLGDYGFLTEADPLGKLSWKLHHELASSMDGRRNWNFTEILIRSLHSEDAKQSPFTLRHDRPLPPWFNYSAPYTQRLIADSTSAARLDPRMFCEYLLARSLELGVDVRTNVIPKEVVESGDGKLLLRVQPKYQETWYINFDNLVLAAGPWSQRALERTFPNARVAIPMNTTNTASNHLRIKVPNWTAEDDKNCCDQIYLAGIIGRPLDISSFLGGTLYVGGYGADPEVLPPLPTDVKPQPDAIKAMIELSERVLNLKRGTLIVLEEGRCYRPTVAQSRPIITEVRLVDLLGQRSVNSGTARVFFNLGHGSDGITLAPGSGKCMSELIRGVRTSADISSLGLGEVKLRSHGVKAAL